MFENNKCSLYWNQLNDNSQIRSTPCPINNNLICIKCFRNVMGLTLVYVTWVSNPKDLWLNWYCLSQNWWSIDCLELYNKWFSFEPFLMFSYMLLCKDSPLRENTLIRECKLLKFRSRWKGKDWLDLFFTTFSLPPYHSSPL